jgi:hypothetical protein
MKRLRHQRLAVRPFLEFLESRCLLSNVPVNNPAEDVVLPNGFGRVTQSETSTAVAKDGTIIVAFNDTEETFGNIFTAFEHGTGYAYSTDGGKTFIDADRLPESDAGDGGDPLLAVNKTNGHLYFSTVGSSFFSTNVVQVFKSVDNGRTFGTPVNAFPNLPDSDFLDKPWMTVDNADGRGNGTIYVTANDFSDSDITLLVSESTSDGASWQQQQLASGAVEGSNVVVDSNHQAYAFWWDGNQAAQRILMKKSDNKGVFGSTATTVATLRTQGIDGGLGLDFRTNAFPQAAVNPEDSNKIYLVYNDQGLAAGDRGDIFFTQSTNGGRSWTKPVKLNDDNTTADQFFPTLTVTPDGNHIFVTWYDRRNAATPNGNIERFGVIGTIDDDTVSFGHNFDYSDAPFPEVFGHDTAASSDYMGDYDQATSDNANFYTSFVDTRRGNQDVFFQKIPVPRLLSPSVKPWLVVNGSPDAAAEGTSSTDHGLGSSLPTALADHNAIFANLGQLLAPASSVTDAPGHSNATVAGRQSETVAVPIRAASATVGSDPFQISRHHTSDAPDDDMGFSTSTDLVRHSTRWASRL